MGSNYTTPYEVRLACRGNNLSGFASRALGGYLCVNAVMMDRQYADDFLQFCKNNPRSCPLLAVLPPGVTECPDLARDLDIRTDLGSYDILRNGEVEEQRNEVTCLFQDDMVTFLTGSSVSFDGLLIEKGLAPEFGPCIQITSRQCRPSGPFKTPMAVTLRIFSPDKVEPVWNFTARFPKCHGAPLGKNIADELGIEDPDLDFRGRPVDSTVQGDRLYWACGITPSLAAQQARLPFMISYTPGHALMTDIPTESLAEEIPDEPPPAT